MMESLFDHAGEEEAPHGLTSAEAESLGAPDTFTRELGLQHFVEVRRGSNGAEEQRARFVELCRAADDNAVLPHDTMPRELRWPDVFGYRGAMRNSRAETDDELHPPRPVPRWEGPA